MENDGGPAFPIPLSDTGPNLDRIQVFKPVSIEGITETKFQEYIYDLELKSSDIADGISRNRLLVAKSDL